MHAHSRTTYTTTLPLGSLSNSHTSFTLPVPRGLATVRLKGIENESRQVMRTRKGGQSDELDNVA